MTKNFTPPYPKPHKSKSTLFKRIIRAWDSWIHVVYEKSYTLKLGEVNMPAIDMYVAGEPSLVERILGKDADQFPKHEELAKLLRPLMGNSIFTTNGEVWAAQRSMLKKAFGHTHLRRTFDSMSAASDDLLTLLNKKHNTSNVFDVEPYMTHIAADIIYRTMFSENLTEHESKIIYDSFHAYQKNAQRAFILRLYGLPTFYHNKKVNREAKQIRETFGKYIKARFDKFNSLNEEEKSNYEERDILDSLLTAKHPSTAARFDLEEIIDQLGLFFIAGHETSATTLTWALYLIAKSPELQQELLEEVNNSLENGELTFDSTRQLKTLNFVFQETLRLYPPVGFLMREASCPMELRKKEIKEGSLIVVSPWLIQRSSNHWKNPHEFDPQRFDLTDEAAQVRCPVHDKASEEAYLPFGRGQRICMGASFAQQEAMIVLAKILLQYKINFVEKKEPEVISRVTTRPKHGIRLKFTPRSVTNKNN